MARLSRRSVLAGTAAITGSLGAYRIGLAQAQQSTIRIGFSAPLSGPFEPSGRPYRIGAEIARDQINKAGGVLGRQLELVEYDDKGDPNQAIAGLRELTGQGINLIMGIPITATAMAAIGVVPSVNAVLTCTGTGEERLTHELFNRHFFTAAENNYTRVRAFARFIAQRHPDISSWTAALMDAGVAHDSWTMESSALKEFYKSLANKDVTIIDPAFVKVGATDFRNQISALMGSNAEGLYMVQVGTMGINLMQQQKAYGLAGKFKLIGDQGLDVDLAKTLKENLPPNVWSLAFWNFQAHPDNKAGQDTYKAWQEKTGDPVPHGFVGPPHIALNAYVSAIKATGGTETEKIISALEDLKLDTIKGAAYYRKEDHQIVCNIDIFHAVGKDSAPGFEIVEAVTIDGATVINPPAPGTPWKIQG
jgi:branched-chain amino acid transport system substrate-binding protein